MSYTIEVNALDGTPMDEVPGKNKTFSWKLNSPGSIYFTLPSEHDKCTKSLLYPGERELVARRNYELLDIQEFSRYVLKHNPLMYWPMDSLEGLELDGSGNGYHGTIGSATDIQRGFNGLVYDGSYSRSMKFTPALNSYVANDSFTPTLVGSLTVFGWFIPYTVSSSNRIFSKASPASLMDFMLSTTSTGKAQFALNTTTHGPSAIGATSLVIGNVYFIVGVWDGVNAKVYLNGILDATSSAAGGTILDQTNNLRAGSWSLASQWADAAIDAVGIIQGALTPQEVLDLYNVGVGKYSKVKNRSQKIWGGYLWAAATQEDGKTVGFNGEGWLSRLEFRHMDETKIYTDIDQFDIAWDIIDFTQQKTNGDLGFTRYSDVPSGVDRSFVFAHYERKQILEILQKFTEMENGFDMEITPDKEWKTYYPYRGSQTNYKFIIDKNIKGWSYTNDAKTHIATDVDVIGSGEGDDTLIASVSDATMQARMKILEKITSSKDTSNISNLTDLANEVLRISKTPREDIQLQVKADDPLFGSSYWLGDTVNVEVVQGYVDVERDLRITTIVVQESNDGDEAIGLYFDETVENV